jgi:diguanylate cyclase (GGDEF)-like protein
VAENLRQAVGRIRVTCNGERIAFTISIGLATETPGQLDPAVFLNKADQLLYQAKQSGRNRTLVPT